MVLKFEQEVKKETIHDIAKQMMIAARTAPKGRGLDYIEIALTDEDDIERIAKRMEEIDQEMDFPAFTRDAKNLRKADACIILGTKIQSVGLKKCGMCGYKNCAEKEKNPNHPCVFNTTDLGIAVGSAVSVAMNHRVDNRIFYTAGQAILDLKMLGEDVKIAYAIPLSSASKNIFFDRT